MRAFLTLIATIVVAASILAPSEAAADKTSGHFETNGVNYYYEIYGTGEPVLMLHGGLGSIEMLGPVLTTVAEKRQVIAVDLQGHGRTPLGTRKLSLPAMGDDMAALVAKLGFKQVDVMGYSMGGGVAFRFAAQHPELVRRLVLVSAGFAQDGFYPEMLPQQAAVSAKMAPQMKDTPMYKNYAAVAPNPAEFPKLLDAMGEWMRTPYNWQADVSKLTMPVMLVFGDSDMYRPEHEIKFYQLLGGGLKDAGWQREQMSKNRLAILPGLTHYDIFMSPVLATTALPFLNGEMNTMNWSNKVPEKK